MFIGKADFTNQLLSCHIDQRDYLLVSNPDKSDKNEQFVFQNLKIVELGLLKRPSLQAKIDSAQLLLTIACNEVSKHKGFDDEDTRKLAACAYQAIKNLEKYPSVVRGQFDLLKQKAFFTLMGQKVLVDKPNTSQQNFINFIESNHIHYKINHLGIPQLGNIPFTIPVTIDGQPTKWVPFDQLEVKEDFQTKVNSFYFEGVLLFQTDENKKLVGFGFCGDLGIMKSNEKTQGIEKGVISRQGDGKCHLIICTAYGSETSPSFLGDHSYFGLVNEEGRVSYVGQFGVVNELGWKDILSAFAHKKAGIESPDRYSGLPYTSYYTTTTEREISPEQYKKLKGSVIKDIENGPMGSIIEDNCTAYVKSSLAKVDINVEVVMSPASWLGRKLVSALLPRAWATKVINSTPAPIKVLLYCLAYPITLVWGLLQFFLSGESDGSASTYRNLSHILNTFFCPWRMKVHHPLALREWQLNQQVKNDG